MAPRFLEHHLGKLAGPHVRLKPSSPSTKRHGTQGVSSSHQVRITGKPALQWSQSPEKAPQTASAVFMGYLLTSNFGWRAVPGLLPYIPHPCVSYHNIWLADVLTCPDFPWPVSSLMQPSE